MTHTAHQVARRYLRATYGPDTLDIVMAGLGMLLVQSVIVSNEYFSEAEIQKYLKARRAFQPLLVEACMDLAQELGTGSFGPAAVQASRTLSTIGGIPFTQPQRVLRLSAKAFRGLKAVIMDLEGDPRIRKLVYVAERISKGYSDEYGVFSAEAMDFVRKLTTLGAIPAPVRTLLRKALKFMRRGDKLDETANPGAWFEMPPERQAKLTSELLKLEDEQSKVYSVYEDPEARRREWTAISERIQRLRNAAGVNLALIKKGPQNEVPSLDAVLRMESKQLADGPTQYIQQGLLKQLKDAYSTEGALPRDLKKVVTQFSKARNFNTMRRVLQEAVDQKLIYPSWITTLENYMAKASRNLAVKKGIQLTPLQWEPLDEAQFSEKHNVGRVTFEASVPEKDRRDALGRVSRALEDLESIFGKGFAGKHDKKLNFEFEGSSTSAAASYYAYDRPGEWQPRVRFGEDSDGLLAHELSHYFDDLLANKIDKVLYPGSTSGPMSRDLFGTTGVDLRYSASQLNRPNNKVTQLIPEIGEFAQAVVDTPDFQRWEDMTGSAHELGVTKAIQNLTGLAIEDLPKSHPYYSYIYNPPLYKSQWDPQLLAETEKAYTEMRGGDSRKLRYYNSGVEVWARMVEQYVATKLAEAGIANPWLTQLTYDTQDLPQMMDQDMFESKIVPILDRLFLQIKSRKLIAKKTSVASQVASRFLQA